MNYKHTQIGYLMIFVLIGLILYFGVMLLKVGFNMVIDILIFAILFIIASFISLTVMIDEEYLRIKFGYGIYSKSFALQEIISAKAVRNHWYNGWGIRVWFWPYRWTFNISGLDAVEITMRDNKIYRIGTDEPQKLEKMIKKSIVL